MKVPADLAPGEKTLRCQVAYQVCDAKSCLPPFRWTLPAVALTVLPGPAAVRPAEAPKVAAVAAETVAAEAGEAPKTVSEVEEKARQGIIPLMIASALGGLLALVMPCVWPMVPITVNFFVKQGQAKNGQHDGPGGDVLPGDHRACSRRSACSARSSSRPRPCPAWRTTPG